MNFDNHVNLLIGTVKLPPSPSTTGQTLTLMPGDGARFQSDMPVTLSPPNVEPDHDNSEIAYLTGVEGEDLTITRGQEGTTAMQIAPGWVVRAGGTAKTFTDIEDAVAAKADASSLAAVATSGSYADLSNKPTIPDTSNLVPNTRQVNGHALTADVTVTKGDVGLGSADNTSDLNKPISTATQTALNGKANTSHTHAESDVTGLVSDLAGKEPTVSAGTSSQYYRGDKTWQTLSQDVVPDGTTNKVYSATDKTKLAGIAAGATANSPDATLLSRANHTGTQAISTVANLQSTLDSKVAHGDLMLNAKDYGALGDGSTDDTAAIQSALNALSTGGWLHVPAGNYIVNGTINVPSNVRITGAGMDDGTSAPSTTFKRGTAAGAPMFRLNGTAPSTGTGVSPSPKRRITLSDFTIRGNSTSDDLIEAYYTNRNHFARIRFISTTGHAVHGVELWDTTFDACQFDLTGDATHSSVQLQNRASSTVGASGYSNDNINRITFRSCTWESFTSQCVELDATSNGSTHQINNITIDDCKFETTTFQNPFISLTTSCRSVYIKNSYFAADSKDPGYAGGAADMIVSSGSGLVVDSCLFYQGATGLVTSAVHLTNHSGANLVTGITCNWTAFTPSSGGAVWIQAYATASRDAVGNVKVDVGKRVVDETGISSYRVDPRLYVEADQIAEVVWDQTGTNPKKFTLGTTASGNFSLLPSGNSLWTIKTPASTNFVVFDMTNGRTGFGTDATAASPTSSIHVAGSMTRKTDVKTANYTMTANDSRLLVDATSGNVTMTLPSAVGIAGRDYYVAKVDGSANTVTIATTSTQTINGSSSVVLGSPFEDGLFISDGSNWVRSGYLPVDADSLVTLTGTQTITNKTLTTPTIASFANAAHNHTNSAGGGQIPVGGINATGTASSSTYLRGDGTWATPTGGSGDMLAATYDPANVAQQVVGTTATQTLTNKTLTSPTLTGTPVLPASITANSFAVTFPGASTTIVGRSTADTLTNKTISGSNNTLSNIANASLTNSAITIAGTSTSLGGTITQDTITGLSSTGLVKRTGANTLATATSGTDYAPATSGTSILKGNGSGGFSSATAGSDYLAFSGTAKITVGTTAPASPSTGDLWIDTN